MLQRIQSLYLLTAVILMALMLGMTFAEIAGAGGNIYSFNSRGLSGPAGKTAEVVLPAWPQFILVLLLAVLLLISIFLYRNRRLQIRICVYSIVLEFGLLGLMYYYFITAVRSMEVAEASFYFPVLIPVLVIILIYLAFRGIRKDDILVRSLDKIR